MQEKLLDAEELAQILSVKQLHIYKMIEQGLPFVDVGVGTERRSYRFKYSEVSNWLEEKRNTEK